MYSPDTKAGVAWSGMMSLTVAGAENGSGAPLVTSATFVIESVGEPWAHQAPDQVLFDRARCWLLRMSVDRFDLLGSFQFHIKNKFWAHHLPAEVLGRILVGWLG
jgi:hypothetical protein